MCKILSNHISVICNRFNNLFNFFIISSLFLKSWIWDQLTILMYIKLIICKSIINVIFLTFYFYFYFFFIKCMQSMTMTLSRRCMYAKLHVTWSKSLLYIFSLINHIDSLHIQALLLKLSQSYFRFSLFLHTLRVLLFRFWKSFSYCNSSIFQIL